MGYRVRSELAGSHPKVTLKQNEVEESLVRAQSVTQKVSVGNQCQETPLCPPRFGVYSFLSSLYCMYFWVLFMYNIICLLFFCCGIFIGLLGLEISGFITVHKRLKQTGIPYISSLHHEGRVVDDCNRITI